MSSERTTITDEKFTVSKGAIRKGGGDAVQPSVDDNKKVSIRLSQLGTGPKTAAELNLQILSERVLFIIRTTIRKLEIAACLPLLLQEEKVLKKYLKPAEYEFIYTTCRDYGDPECMIDYIPSDIGGSEIANQLEKISMYNFGRGRKNSMKQKKPQQKKSIKGHEEQAHRKQDIYMSQVVEILFKTEAIHQHIGKLYSQIDDQVKQFLNCMQQLKAFAETRLKITAEEVRERESLLRKAWKDKKELEAEVKRLEDLLNKQRQELNGQVEEKENLVIEYEDKIEALQNDFKEAIKKRIKDSEETMVKDTEDSEAKQEALAQEAKETQDKYQALLEEHIAYEKKLRAKKHKTEQQLASWLAKYDIDIGERQAELEEITKGYEEEMEEFEALQEKFDEQQEEYEFLMAEKEEMEEKEFQGRYMDFLRNRSARRIQRFWRAYKERKRLRKMRRHKKKK